MLQSVVKDLKGEMLSVYPNRYEDSDDGGAGFGRDGGANDSR